VRPEVRSVRRDEAGEGIAGDLVDQGASQGADRACGRLGGDVDGMAALAQFAGQRGHGGGLAGPAGAVDGDERPRHGLVLRRR
jgi:hypothetical protein